MLRQYEKCLDFRRSGMDCRNPEAKDGFHSLHTGMTLSGLGVRLLLIKLKHDNLVIVSMQQKS